MVDTAEMTTTDVPRASPFVVILNTKRRPNRAPFFMPALVPPRQGPAQPSSMLPRSQLRDAITNPRPQPACGHNVPTVCKSSDNPDRGFANPAPGIRRCFPCSTPRVVFFDHMLSSAGDAQVPKRLSSIKPHCTPAAVEPINFLKASRFKPNNELSV